MNDCPHGHVRRQCETCDAIADRDRVIVQNRQRAGILLHIASVLGDAPVRAEADLPGAIAELKGERDRLRAAVAAAGDVALRHMVDCHATQCEKCETLGEMYVPLDQLEGQRGGDVSDETWRKLEAETDRLRDERVAMLEAENARLREIVAATIGPDPESPDDGFTFLWPTYTPEQDALVRRIIEEGT